jgi:hypothetical protein
MISWAGFGTPSTAWTPIDELDRTDADVSAIMLTSNSVRYDNPVDDPIFATNTMMNGPIVADFDAVVVGCTYQYQFCKVLDTKWTNLATSGAALAETRRRFPKKDDLRWETAHRLGVIVIESEYGCCDRRLGLSAVRGMQLRVYPSISSSRLNCCF